MFFIGDFDVLYSYVMVLVVVEVVLVYKFFS